ncbi:acyl carrier protein [Micromonospora sp. Llam7]|uniref:acyl carrier protein n=1 Tax=Micromonospora tarapacensis TaxID=2835305 RepID=UPI001C83D1DD|nr:acyl carrier protein [Micromonospora tarapacensis]MBX7266518.1 acyl carrier protein [Micromonospora tarapacensis]
MSDIDDAEIRTALRKALGEVLDRDLAEIDDGTRLFGDLGLDSTSVIELLMALEDSVGVQVDPEELTAEVFDTVGTLTTYVSTCLAAPEPAN